MATEHKKVRVGRRVVDRCKPYPDSHFFIRMIKGNQFGVFAGNFNRASSSRLKLFIIL